MTRRSDQRGAALLAVFLFATALLPIAAWLAIQAQLDAGIAGNLHGDLRVFYVAEAGLADALATLDGLPSAAAALAGPDGEPNTGDDGAWWGAPGATSTFPTAPYGYSIRLEAAGADLVRVRCVGRGAHGESKEIEAIVHWLDGALRAWSREIL